MPEKRKIAVIINPVAGRGKTIEALPQIKAFFNNHLDKIDPLYMISQQKGDVTKKAFECYQQGYKAFVVVGGDGTVSELINGFSDTLQKDSPSEENLIKVAIIPLGTGNDFVKVISGKKEISQILEDVLEDRGQVVDIGIVNGFVFLNVCSCGIDGPIIYDTEKFKKVIPGHFSYMVSTIKAGMTFKADEVNVQVDDVLFENKMLLIAVGNGKYIGGGMNVCPTAKLDDGLLEVCMIENVGKLKFAKEMGKIYSGRLGELNEVTYQKGTKIRIETKNQPYYINADGNIIGKTPAEIQILPKRLFIYRNF
jgi:YegS/Rv2252/BmrU family lipid kinase